jgi:two-component SAPR family response regulator
MKIMLIGNDLSAFDSLAKRLGQEEEVSQVYYVENGAAGLEFVRKNGDKGVDLVIVGRRLADMGGIQFIRELVRINPQVYTVLVGSLPDKIFHEATEGLGVLLQLPPHPKGQDAEKLLSAFRKITILTQPEAVGAENQ